MSACCTSSQTNLWLCFQIELIDRVDDIYRNTSWDDEFSGYGVQIQQVRLGLLAASTWFLLQQV